MNTERDTSDLVLYEHELPIDRCSSCGATVNADGTVTTCLGEECSYEQTEGDTTEELNFTDRAAGSRLAAEMPPEEARQYAPDELISGAQSLINDLDDNAPIEGAITAEPLGGC
jgi:hypothetical protein